MGVSPGLFISDHRSPDEAKRNPGMVNPLAN
jgi:hypothetical protein